MLDLHLFLGRPLKVADKNSTINDADLFGSVPQRIVDEEEDFLRTAHDHSHDLVRNSFQVFILCTFAILESSLSFICNVVLTV